MSSWGSLHQHETTAQGTSPVGRGLWLWLLTPESQNSDKSLAPGHRIRASGVYRVTGSSVPEVAGEREKDADR